MLAAFVVKWPLTVYGGGTSRGGACGNRPNQKAIAHTVLAVGVEQVDWYGSV